MCKLYYYVQTTCYTASVAILIVICLERYVAIIYSVCALPAPEGWPG